MTASAPRQRSAIIDGRPVLPGDVPDVPFGIAEAEAAEAMRRVDRVVEITDALDPEQGLVDGDHLGSRREVDAQGETAEAVGPWSVVTLVVMRAVERQDDAILELEHPMGGLGRGCFRPAERAEEFGHPGDVATGQGEEVHPRRDHRDRSTATDDRPEPDFRSPGDGGDGEDRCDEHRPVLHGM